MLQNSLFHERIEDAIASVIERCGGRKVFACEIYPDKPPRDAHNLVDACLNPERREKFAPSQLMYIMKRGRQVGCHDLTMFISREAGYADPIPVEPEDEIAKLQREFIEATKALSTMAARIEQINTGTRTMRRAA